MVLLLLIYRIKELLWHTLLRHLHYLKSAQRQNLYRNKKKKKERILLVLVFLSRLEVKTFIHE